MRRSHSADYGSRLRSDSATTQTAKTSDYYSHWSGLSYHCLYTVVYFRIRVLWIGNGPERSAKHSRQLGMLSNTRENSRDYVVKYSAVSDKNSINVLCWAWVTHSGVILPSSSQVPWATYVAFDKYLDKHGATVCTMVWHAGRTKRPCGCLSDTKQLWIMQVKL